MILQRTKTFKADKPDSVEEVRKHFAVKVDARGSVTEWSNFAKEACEIDVAMRTLIEGNYKNRANYGKFEFVKADGKKAEAKVEEPAVNVKYVKGLEADVKELESELTEASKVIREKDETIALLTKANTEGSADIAKAKAEVERLTKLTTKA